MKTHSFEFTTERDFEYPYDKAIRDIGNYHQYVSGLDVPFSYTVNKEDLLFLINELMNLDEKGIGIRCYPAREHVPAHEGSDGRWIPEHYHHHLLMVGVVEDTTTEHGVRLYPDGRDVYNMDGVETGSRIFDLSRPCPRMCDLNSQLFKAASGEPIELLPPTRESEH